MAVDRRLRAGTPRSQARSALAEAARKANECPEDPSLQAEVARIRAEYRVVTLEEHIQRVVSEPPLLTAEQRSKLALLLVDEKIAAAVEAAPPLPQDLDARLTQLIRSTPASTEEAA